MTLLELLMAIDPKYGDQTHQRAFMARMERAQALTPCTKDHSGDKPPVHRTACYPCDRQGRMSGS